MHTGNIFPANETAKCSQLKKQTKRCQTMSYYEKRKMSNSNQSALYVSSGGIFRITLEAKSPLQSNSNVMNKAYKAESHLSYHPKI